MSTATPDAGAQKAGTDAGGTASDLTAVAALPLLELSAPPPAPVESSAQLRDAVAALAAGRGPVAVDAERASGYRYGQRCYLVQLRREGSGTVLVDPIPLGDLSLLDRAIADAEWVVHAASQDLPCLAEVGLRPRTLFDTELAARLAGYDRVGLATMVERVLGARLEKGHSAADWSQRPLSPPLLRYAALDVEVLVELRDHLEAELRAQGKLDWALEEFAALVAAPPPPPRSEPWRRTSGLHRVRTPRQLATVRALWELRDEMARKRDLAPGRILPDTAIVEAAVRAPDSAEALAGVPPFGGRVTRRSLARWFEAVQSAAALPSDALPALASQSDAPPPPHRWADREPAAAARLARARAAVAERAAEHSLPTENLVEPAVVRRLAWSPPPVLDAESVAGAMRLHGARAWQINLTAGALAASLADG